MRLCRLASTHSSHFTSALSIGSQNTYLDKAEDTVVLAVRFGALQDGTGYTVQMKSVIAAVVTAAVLFPAVARAQIKTIPGESLTVTTTVDAIDHAARSVTLRKPDNSVVKVDVPKEATRFDALKVGDKVTATYYDNIVLRVKKPGEKDVNSVGGSFVPTEGLKPGFTIGAQRVMTALITAIDQTIPSISLSGPNNWSYTTRVEDKDALKLVKVGDRLDITWTEAVMLSTTAPK